MKFLLDTNALIPAEPTTPEGVEELTPVIVELLRLATQGGHVVFVHPASLEELGNDKKTTRRQLRQVLALKYPQLEEAPLSKRRELESTFGTPRPASHDEFDLRILASLASDAVDYLVTADDGIHRRARRVGLATRVVTAADASAIVRALFPVDVVPPPAVRRLLAYELDLSDQIFASLRQEYPGFDSWLAKCRREHRIAWVVEQRQSEYAALCLINHEREKSHGLTGKVLKICTFKVSDRHRGFRLGELLLKTVFEHAFSNRYDSIFVEVFPRHTELMSLVDDFGFEQAPLAATPRAGERVYVKQLSVDPARESSLDDFEYHRLYGPRYFRIPRDHTFIVPIQPAYHNLLFPEASAQQALFLGTHPFGNSLRKAYLCHAPSNQVARGSLLLFYRSRDLQAVNVVGVAEETLRTVDADQIARFVGKTTVYSLDQIRAMCAREVLVIRFRQAATLREAITSSQLVSEGLLRGHPQSITRAGDGGIKWLDHKLAGR